jgi:hypothetical protein
VMAPEALPNESRKAILAEARSRDIRISLRLTRLKRKEDEEDQ